jgi:hypothetical protein
VNLRKIFIGSRRQAHVDNIEPPPFPTNVAEQYQLASNERLRQRQPDQRAGSDWNWLTRSFTLAFLGTDMLKRTQTPEETTLLWAAILDRVTTEVFNHIDAHRSCSTRKEFDNCRKAADLLERLFSMPLKDPQSAEQLADRVFKTRMACSAVTLLFMMPDNGGPLIRQLESPKLSLEDWTEAVFTHGCESSDPDLAASSAIAKATLAASKQQPIKVGDYLGRAKDLLPHTTDALPHPLVSEVMQSLENNRSSQIPDLN